MLREGKRQKKFQGKASIALVVARYNNEITEVEITREPVELYKILKFESMVASGGEAKMVIAEGLVKVNGEVETQKRKKIMSGDMIEFNNEKLLIKLQLS